MRKIVKPHKYKRIRKPEIILLILPFHDPLYISTPSEALVVVSLPSPLEIVATEISLYDNEGAVRKLGVVGRTTKKRRAVASLGTRMRVVVIFEISSPGELARTMCWEFPGPWVVSYDSRECKRPAKHFSPHPRDNTCVSER